MSDLDRYEEIGVLLLGEIERRFASPELAAELPGTLLMKLFGDYIAYLKRKQALEEEKLSQDHVDPLEMIDQPGLSLERRIAVLAEYLEELEDVWRRSSARMEELLNAKEDDDGDGDQVQELPDMVPEGV